MDWSFLTPKKQEAENPTWIELKTEAVDDFLAVRERLNEQLNLAMEEVPALDIPASLPPLAEENLMGSFQETTGLEESAPAVLDLPEAFDSFGLEDSFCLDTPEDFSSGLCTFQEIEAVPAFELNTPLEEEEMAPSFFELGTVEAVVPEDTVCFDPPEDDDPCWTEIPAMVPDASIASLNDLPVTFISSVHELEESPVVVPVLEVQEASPLAAALEAVSEFEFQPARSGAVAPQEILFSQNLTHIQQEALMTEVRFVQNSINHLVESYFRQKTAELSQS